MKASTTKKRIPKAKSQAQSGKQILIIYTGGTIGMMKDHQTNALVPVDFGTITEQIPELKNLNCEIGFEAFGIPLDSSNVHPEFWGILASMIARHYDRYDGFVVLHGTDTMAYTASALSFLFDQLAKPVIMTGSQLPLGEIRTDAKRNLITAVEIAARAESLPEVCIYFNNRLFRGNRVEKYTSSKFDAFQSLNYPVLAEAGVNIVFNHDAIRPMPSGKFKLLQGFNTDIALIKIYPGIHLNVMEATLRSPGLKAAVIETFGSGNAPTEPAFIRCLSDAIQRGIILLNISQCSGGTVTQGKYQTSYHLKKIGMTGGNDMTTEAALTKLMFLLGREKNITKVKKLLGEDLRGELSASDKLTAD